MARLEHINMDGEATGWESNAIDLSPQSDIVVTLEEWRGMFDCKEDKMKDDLLKRSDQIALLKVSLVFTETGKFNNIFTYPRCGPDLVKQGMATEDGIITMAGRTALFLLGEGPDPSDLKSFIEFSIPL